MFGGRRGGIKGTFLLHVLYKALKDVSGITDGDDGKYVVEIIQVLVVRLRQCGEEGGEACGRQDSTRFHLGCECRLEVVRSCNIVQGSVDRAADYGRNYVCGLGYVGASGFWAVRGEYGVWCVCICQWKINLDVSVDGGRQCFQTMCRQ